VPIAGLEVETDHRRSAGEIVGAIAGANFPVTFPARVGFSEHNQSLTMKLITILTSITGLSLATFALGLTFVPARRSWQPRPAEVLAPARRTAALPLAV
jgi:hypothetical protein